MGIDPTRFTGTSFLNAHVLRKHLNCNEGEVPRDIQALPGFIEWSGDTVTFETGEESPNWVSASNRRKNREIRDKDGQIRQVAQRLADRFYGGNLYDVLYQTQRIFTGIDRHYLSVGLVKERNWGA